MFLGYFEILSDRFRVTVRCPQVALRLLSGGFQVAVKSLWVCVKVAALQLLSDFGRRSFEVIVKNRSCSEVAVRLFWGYSTAALRLF